jgi:hypothetical protein
MPVNQTWGQTGRCFQTVLEERLMDRYGVVKLIHDRHLWFQSNPTNYTFLKFVTVLVYTHYVIIILCSSETNRLCGLVVRVPGYRLRGPGSFPGATRFREALRDQWKALVNTKINFLVPWYLAKLLSGWATAGVSTATQIYELIS